MPEAGRDPPLSFYSLHSKGVNSFLSCHIETGLKIACPSLRPLLPSFVQQGELMRAFRHAPRKESAFATVTAGMRVLFCEGSSIVRDMSIYFGGVGPTTTAATKTCGTIVSKSELFSIFLFLLLKVQCVIFLYLICVFFILPFCAALLSGRLTLHSSLLTVGFLIRMNK